MFDKAFELGSEMKEHRKYMDSLITGALNDEEERTQNFNKGLRTYVPRQ